MIYARLYHQVVDLPAELASIPTVVVNARERTDAVPWIAPDDVGIGRTAVERLVAAGHRRIGFAQNEEDIPATELREQGYREALATAGIDVDPDLIVRASHWTHSGYTSGLALLTRDDPATGIFCFSDRVAVGVYQAAAELGVPIGPGLSVVGVDNLEFIAPDMRPGLTTIELPHKQMGTWGVETLSRVIAGEDIGEADAHIHLTCQLIERASVQTHQAHLAHQAHPAHSGAT